MADDDTRPDLSALTRAAGDIISVRRVFGEPYQHDGTLVVPVAKVLGWHAVAGAHGDARLGVRRGRGGPGDAGGPEAAVPGADAAAPGGDGDEHEAAAGGHGAHTAAAPAVRAPGAAEPSAVVPGPFPPGPAARGPRGRGPRWPAGSRPGGRGLGTADAGGYATRVKPLGVFVVDDAGVRWQPALDLNRAVVGGQLVATVATVALAWALGRRRR